MYESKEESSFCCRCLCRGHRSFRMPIVSELVAINHQGKKTDPPCPKLNNFGSKVMVLDRRFDWGGCALFPCCLQQMQVMSNPDVDHLVELGSAYTTCCAGGFCPTLKIADPDGIEEMSLRGTWCRGTLCGSKWALKDAKGAYMGHVKRQGVLGGGIKGAAAKGLTNGGLRAAAPGGAAGLTKGQQPTTSSCTSTPRTSRTRGRRRWSSRRPCSSTVRRRTGAGGLAEGLTPRPLLPPAVDMFYESSGVVSVGADGLRLTCCDVYCCGEYTRAAAHVCGRGGGLTETKAASSRAAPTPAPSIAAAAAGRTSRSCRSRCGCDRRPAAAAPSIFFFRLPQTVVDTL